MGGFADMFGGAGRGGQKRSTKRPGSDLRYDLDITLEEAAKGCTKKLEIERLVTCKTCHGTGARDGKEAFKSCPTCQGRGIITQQSGFFVQQSTCPTCHGTGEIISDPCPVCRGEGRVREDSHITIRIPFSGMGGFADMFGGAGRGGQKRSTKRPGSDLRYDLDITLEEAAKGCTKKLEIERLVTCKTCHGTGARDGKEAFKSCPTCQGRGIITQQSGFFVQQSTCPTCHGTGEIISDPCPVCRGEGRVREDSHITIRIPAGVATGSQLRIAGEGDAGVHGGPTGDLHVFIDVKPHDIFQREGNDLSCTVPVPLSLAVSGGRLKVPTLEGAATIKLPEGTQNGMIFRLRGKGVKALRSSDVGDMLVEVEVEIPSRLTKEQMDKLNAFASALDENRNQPACVEFADKAARYLKGK